MTQVDFERQRLERMARAQQAKEQECLEKAKRQAQRSKRVAGFIIDPKKLEETKAAREREALTKIREGKMAEEAAKRAAEEARTEEKEERQAKAALAGERAEERLRERKAAERQKALQAKFEAEAMAEAQERAQEEARQQRAEQRRLRAETSFFARATDVIGNA